MSKVEPVWWRRAPGLRGRTRRFLINHIQWRAFEYRVASSAGEVSLMFACDTAWRRVRKFPANWADQDDASLRQLSTGT